MELVEEQSTRHHRGRWHGFGPVQNSEMVIFAIFEDTKRSGCVLTIDSFQNLKNQTQSLARINYTPRTHFNKYVVKEKKLHGVAIANVHSLRNLEVVFDVEGKQVKCRAICVLDIVELGDCEGHATMGYTPKPEKVSAPQLGKKRKLIALDVVNAFSPIAAADTYSWPPWWRSVFLGRLKSVAREAVLCLTTLIRRTSSNASAMLRREF